MKTRPYFPWLVILLLLSSCGSQPQAISPTQSAMITATTMRTNSPTPVRTETPSPTPDLIRQTIDAYYETSRATEDARSSAHPATETAVAAFLPPSDPFTDDCYGSSLISPDGNWIAIDCGFASKTLQIFTLDRSRSITITYAEIFGDVDEFYMGGLGPFHWSRDSQSLYFIRWDCCFDAVVLYGLGPLYRVSIQTGKWVQLTDSLMNYYSFSSTERRMLYVNQGHETIQVWDLRTGEIIPIELPGDYSQAGTTVWSEDGLRFASQIGFFDYDPHYGIFLVDLEANTHQLIYESNVEVMPISWSEDHILTIAKPVLLATYNDHDFYVDQYLFYDTNSSSFIENTPSP